MILSRCDYAGVMVFDAGATSAPGCIAATITPEGYLIADAHLARDGLLPYSDGENQWVEYRPASELIAAAATFGPQNPITDNHPGKMVDADSWAQVARGVHLAPAEVVVIDGVTYLRAPIAITDRKLVATVLARHEAGQSVELSIGVWSDVQPTNGMAPDGTRCDAMQLGLVGNHTAIVLHGRAGPLCRIVFDGATVPVSNPYEDIIMTIAAGQQGGHSLRPSAAFTSYLQTLTQPGARTDGQGQPQPGGAPPNVAPRRDMSGGGMVDQVQYPGPNGPEMIPTWAAAALDQFAALQASMAGGQAQQVAAPAPAADAGAAVKPAPVAVDAAAAPADKEASKDAAGLAVRRRSRYERLATRVGIADAAIDAADDDTLGQLIVAKRMPWTMATIKATRGDALDALVVAAAAMPDQSKTEGGENKPRTDAADPWALAFGQQPGAAQARAAVGARVDGNAAPVVQPGFNPWAPQPQVIERTDAAEDDYDERMAKAAGLA